MLLLIREKQEKWWEIPSSKKNGSGESQRRKKRTLTIEFLMGSPDDRDALFFYNGVMEKLQEYFDDGTTGVHFRKADA